LVPESRYLGCYLIQLVYRQLKLGSARFMFPGTLEDRQGYKETQEAFYILEYIFDVHEKLGNIFEEILLPYNTGRSS